MTFKDIFGSATSPTSSNYYKGYHAASNSQPIMAEREGIGYGHGYTKFKNGHKMDKKHAAMSALTLLAFLFFLNILQNCLKEQIQPLASDVTMMMVMPPKQIKDSSQRKNDENPRRTEARKTRSLLEVKQNHEETTEKTVTRRMKLIHDLKNVDRKWKIALSQVTDKELENQRIKTDNLHLYLMKFKTNLTERNDPMETAKLVPVTSTNAKLKIGNAEKPGTNSFKAKYTSKAFVRTLHGKRNFGGEMETADDWVPTVGSGAPFQANGNYNATSGSNDNKIRTNYNELKKGAIKNHKMEMDNGKGTSESIGKNSTQIAKETRRPPVNLELKALKTYPVHKYRNHKYSTDPYWENQTATLTAIDGVTSSAKRHASVQQRNPALKRLPVRNRYDYANRNRIDETRQPTEFAYKYSPHRRTSNHLGLSPGYREQYYPSGVVDKYPQGDEPGFDLIKFVWMVLSGLVKPLSKIVPGLSKVGGKESQCYELIICEVHRVSRLMGPTAEKLASTFSTLLMWYSSEANRKKVHDAVTSGKENTCQQQILDCDERSGGKSAMTVLAQAMETKVK